MSQNYTEENIKSLDWKEHIRMRPGMYIGKKGDGSVIKSFDILGRPYYDTGHAQYDSFLTLNLYLDKHQGCQNVFKLGEDTF